MNRVLKIVLLVAVLFSAIPALAQNAPVNQETFSLTAQPVALPGGGHTVAGTVAGFTFSPTPNVDLRSDNIFVAGSGFKGFFGGFNYRLPILSTKLNNVSPNVSGFRFQFYLTASAGIDQITSGSGKTQQHYAFLAGGGVNYDLTASGKFSFGAEVRYAKLPGLANNTAIVSVGPAFHF